MFNTDPLLKDRLANLKSAVDLVETKIAETQSKMEQYDPKSMDYQYLAGEIKRMKRDLKNCGYYVGQAKSALMAHLPVNY